MRFPDHKRPIEEKRWHPLPSPITTSWLLSSGVSDTGQNVTPDVAMQAAAVFRCVNVISTSLATIPICIRRRADRTEIKNHPLCKLLNREPNPEMTAAAFRESFMTNLCLWGNGFAFIEKGGGARPIALWPLRAGSTTPYRNVPDLQLTYHAVTGSAAYTLTPDQVLHVPDISYDGIVGLSRTRYSTNPIGLALAMEQYASKFFSNGGNMGGILSVPPMKPEQIRAFIESWRANNSGNENAFKVALLTDGMKYDRVATDPRNAQMVDSRKFEVIEVCRIYGVPPHKVGDLDRATFSNIEQQSIEFVQDCLTPWATKAEQEYERKLLLESEKDELEIRHDFRALLRGDTTSRFEAYNTGITGGWLAGNEAREWEGLPPVDGLEKPRVPLNMGNPGGDPATTKNPPGADPAAGQDDGEEGDDSEDDSEGREQRFNEDQPRRPDGKFGSGGGASSKSHGGSPLGAAKAVAGKLSAVGQMSAHSLVKAGADAKAVAGTFAAAAKDGLDSAWAKLPSKVQSVAKGAWITKGVVLHPAYRASQAAAEKVALARGATPEQAKKLRGILGAVDIASGKALKVGLSLTGLPHLGIAAGQIPVGSASYLAYSTAIHPAATIKAARDAVSKAVAKLKRDAGDGAEVADLIADAMAKHGYSDWHLSLLCAALDETGDAREAIDLAEAAIEATPNDINGD